MKKQDDEETLTQIKLNLLNFLPLFLAIFLPLIFLREVNREIRMSLVTFLAGFSGVVTIFRKEIPITLGSVKGKWAVIQGMAFTVFCWGSAIYFAISALK